VYDLACQLVPTKNTATQLAALRRTKTCARLISVYGCVLLMQWLQQQLLNGLLVALPYLHTAINLYLLVSDPRLWHLLVVEVVYTAAITPAEVHGTATARGTAQHILIKASARLGRFYLDAVWRKLPDP